MQKTIRYGHSNMRVIHSTRDDLYLLKSYDSIVALYDPAEKILVLGRDWDYSVTTKKHLRKFLKDYAPVFSYLSVPKIREYLNSSDEPHIIYQAHIA